jgi:hypothetical protein
VSTSHLHISALVETLGDVAARLSGRVTTPDALRLVDLHDRLARIPADDRAGTDADRVLADLADAVRHARSRVSHDLAEPETLAPFRGAVDAAFRGRAFDVDAWTADLLALAGALAWLEGPARRAADDAVAYGLEAAGLAPEAFRGAVQVAAWRIEVEPVDAGPRALDRALRDLVALPAWMPARATGAGEVVDLASARAARRVPRLAPLSLAADAGESREPPLTAWDRVAHGRGWEMATHISVDADGQQSLFLELTVDRTARPEVDLRADSAFRLHWAGGKGTAPALPTHRTTVQHADRVVLRIGATGSLVVHVPALRVTQVIDLLAADG